MITSEVSEQGTKVEEVYPQVKQWQRYDTFALFSSAHTAVIIAAAASHENDFVGKIVDDPLSDEWQQVKDFSITIKG